MDIGRIFIFSAVIIIALYKFFKNKQEFYLLVAIASWLSLFHVGTYNVKQYFQEPIVSTIDSFSIFLLISILMRYLMFLYKEMKK